MPKTPEQMAESMIANLPEKTGKSLDQWKPIVAKSGHDKHGQIVKWLKAEHGVTHGYANLIATLSRESDGGETDLVTAQYSGKKEHLRPIYDAFAKRVKKLGKDVEFAPKKAYVSLRRSKQFATVGPATNTAVEVGLNLKGVATSGRLKKGTGMVTHRVRLGEVAEVDDELMGWVTAAYESA